MMKLRISVIMIIIILISSFSVYAVDYGEWLYNRGLLEGYNGDLMIDKQLTRAELMVLLVRILGREDIAMNVNFRSTFTDVGDHWAYRYIAYAQGAGWANGYGDGRFGPNDPVSEAQLAALLIKILGYNYGSDLEWSSTMTFAKDLGLDIRTQDPNRITRGETFRYIYNAMHVKVKGSNELLAAKASIEISPFHLQSVTQLGARLVEVVFSSPADPNRTVFQVIGDEILAVEDVTWGRDNTIAFIKTKTLIEDQIPQVFVYGYINGVLSEKVNIEEYKRLTNQSRFTFTTSSSSGIFLQEGTNGYYEIPYRYFDKDGNERKLSYHIANQDGINGVEEIDGIEFRSGNQSILDVDKLIVQNGRLLLPANSELTGNTIITSYIPGNGQSSEVKITINNTSRVDRVEFITNDTTFYLERPTLVSYRVWDQFGREIKAGNKLYDTLTFSKGEKYDDQLLFLPEQSTGSLGAYYQGKLVGSTSFTARPMPRLTEISAFSGYRAVENNPRAYIEIDQFDFTILEQFGNNIRLRGDDYIEIIPLDGKFDVVMPSASRFYGDEELRLYGTRNVGTEEVLFRINGRSTSELKVTFRVVDKNDLDAYRILGPSQIYASGGLERYKISLPVFGTYLEAGEQLYVALDQSIATSFTSSRLSVANVDLVSNQVVGVAEGTASIIAWNQGNKLTSKNVWVVENRPEVRSLFMAGYDLSMAANERISLEALYTAIDQYGVEIHALKDFIVYEQSGTVEVNRQSETMTGSLGSSVTLVLRLINDQYEAVKITFN